MMYLKSDLNNYQSLLSYILLEQVTKIIFGEGGNVKTNWGPQVVEMLRRILLVRAGYWPFSRQYKLFTSSI